MIPTFHSTAFSENSNFQIGDKELDGTAHCVENNDNLIVGQISHGLYG